MCALLRVFNYASLAWGMKLVESIIAWSKLTTNWFGRPLYDAVTFFASLYFFVVEGEAGDRPLPALRNQRIGRDGLHHLVLPSLTI